MRAERRQDRPLFLSNFADEDGVIEAERVGERFGITKIQVAEMTGLKREALHRRERTVAPSTQSRLREVLEIVGRVTDWAGGEKQALAWYRGEPLPSFGGRTAESLVKDGKAAAVRDFLDRVATGGFA